MKLKASLLYMRIISVQKKKEKRVHGKYTRTIFILALKSKLKK